MAKQPYDTNERARQRAAYDLLKLAGKKVKPRFEDYIYKKDGTLNRGRNRSLINRASNLTPVTDVKTFTNKQGKTTSYATFEAAIPRNEEESNNADALRAARDIISLQGRLFNRAQLSMYGYVGFVTKGRKAGMAWINGPMSNKPDAVHAFAKRIDEFEYVTLVRVHFAMNR